MSARLSPTLVGRGDILSDLRQFLDASVSPGTAVILLSGEEGVGKSIMLRAAASEARELGFMVLEGRPQAVELPQPFFLVQELLNSLATQRKKKAASQEGLQNIIPFGIGLPVGRDRGALPMGLIPYGVNLESPEDRERRLLSALSGRETNRKEEEQELFDMLADHIDEIAAGEKLILAIDDLQYIDQASMNFLSYLGRRTRGRNMKVMATCRPDAEVPQAVRSEIGGLFREGLLRRLEIRRLTESESREFITLLSRGREVSPATVSEWFSASRGNPLALIQLFRGGTASGGALREGSLPTDTVFAKLSDEDIRVLALASVFGKSFRFHPLYQAIGGDEEHLTEIIDTLTRSGILKDLGGEVYEFARHTRNCIATRLPMSS